jgi:FkbM family methyltransferase
VSAAALLAGVNRWPFWARTLPVHGRRLRATSLDRLVYLGLHATGAMGAPETRFFKAHVKPGMKVTDVGANLGVYTILFSKLVGPTGRVVAFEPDPGLFAALSENCAGLANVQLVNAAAGAATERRSFSLGGLNSGDNRLLAEGVQAPGSFTVDVVTLDEAAGADVSFVKIDVQGWERDVFQGMPATLGKVPIFFELWPYGLRQAGADPAALLSYLTEAGYSITEPHGADPGSAIDVVALIARLGTRGYTNLYAVPSSAQGPTR